MSCCLPSTGVLGCRASDILLIWLSKSLFRIKRGSEVGIAEVTRISNRQKLRADVVAMIPWMQLSLRIYGIYTTVYKEAIVYMMLQVNHLKYFVQVDDEVAIIYMYI
jgi:hypothetical protein